MPKITSKGFVALNTIQVFLFQLYVQVKVISLACFEAERQMAVLSPPSRLIFRPRDNHFRLVLSRHLYSKKQEAAHEFEISKKENVDEGASCITFAERCKNILAGNWQGILATVKADATGSKEQLHSSSVHYMFKNKKPIMWLQEDDLHTVNTVLDERGSICIDQTDPPPLTNFLRTVGKFPPRIILVGDVIALEDDKVGSAKKELNERILSEKNTMDRASYSVTGILNSSGSILNARVKGLETLLERIETSILYEFNMRSCNYVDFLGQKHDVDLKDIERAPIDPLSPFFGALIEGINRSEARRRGLMLFCFVYLNVRVRDALILSVDRKGFDVLGKVSSDLKDDASSSSHFEWKDFSFSFGREVEDIETFCCFLAKMEEEALNRISGSVI